MPGICRLSHPMLMALRSVSQHSGIQLQLSLRLDGFFKSGWHIEKSVSGLQSIKLLSNALQTVCHSQLFPRFTSHGAGGGKNTCLVRWRHVVCNIPFSKTIILWFISINPSLQLMRALFLHHLQTKAKPPFFVYLKKVIIRFYQLPGCIRHQCSSLT